MTTAPLRAIAHSRAGDKGNLNSLSVIAYSDDGYGFLARSLTVSLVGAHLGFRVTGAVERYEIPRLRTLQFVVEREASDTVTTSTFADTHGKTLSSALLELRLDIPGELLDAESSGAPTSPATLTCCQLAPVIGDVGHNRALTLSAIEEAVDAGSDVIVLPELVTSGYCFESVDEARRSAITRSDPIFDDWRRAAGNAFLAAGFAEIADGVLYNSAVLIDPHGEATWYRKTHLWDTEKAVFTPGDQAPPVVETRLGRIGLLVCYDLEFPELTRSLALAGADLLVVPANWPLLDQIPTGEHPAEVTIAMATARMNHVYVACCDRSGTERGQRWTEGSVIVGANGWPLARTEAGTSTISAVLDLRSARDKSASPRNDVFADRRERIYQRQC